MKKTLSSTTKIRFQNCDPFNHLNNSSYIDYFINAREDQILENYNLDMYQHIKENQAGWVVGSNQIAYFKPAWLMETVRIDSELIHYSETDLLVEMRMWDASKTHLKSILWSKFTYFDLKTQKRKEHPEELTHLFENVVNPISQRSFEERCAHLLHTQKKKLQEV
jgi:acyl-CoA thioester hydrolase